MSKVYGLSVEDTLLRQGRIRGMTHDTLIRTELVKDIVIPEDLTCYEDHFIRRFIEGKGFEWAVTKEAFCFHHEKTRSYSRKTMNNIGRILKKYHSVLDISGGSTIFRNFILLLPKCLWILVNTGDYASCVQQAKTYTFMFEGWLKEWIS